MPGFFVSTHTPRRRVHAPAVECSSTPPLNESGIIIDAGGSHISAWMKEKLQETLLWSRGPYQASGVSQRLLPSPLLSDKSGMEIWDQINRLPTYYQTDAEVELLQQHGAELASFVSPNTIIVDLGCGDVRKVRPLLDILEELGRPVWYFALDLCKESLARCMAHVEGGYKHVKCFALWGSFDTGLEYIHGLQSDRPRLFLSLGSIFGNDHFPQAVSRLAQWAQDALRGPRDAMLLTMDATSSRSAIWASYHDEQGLFEKFIRNGYQHSNEVLGAEWYRDEDWVLDSVLKADPTVHIFTLRAVRQVTCPELGLELNVGDKIDCYEAFKYGPNEMRKQFVQAKLKEKVSWKAPSADIYQYLLTPAMGD